VRGVFHNQTSAMRATRCVIAGNTSIHGGKPPLYSLGGPGSGNNVTECALDDVYELDGVPNCRYAEPEKMFKKFAAGDYRLGPASPAINAGPLLSPQEIAAAGVDLDGKPRVVGTRMDHGCYESPVRGTLFLIR